ncbi:hypothetical protein [Acidovorax sp. PRC11]|uniref:hypothetical protein n=1 Tax=Acidovorax sp. PRC11 TaxID=2962592 RepID=UPI002882248E|nr:hypothetical protein [Acidovorax sp. PRC11]MDT0140197.1 hypothetical protein [Acidovorax sp. PRC11]
MADWTTTTVTTWEPEWMRSTTRQRLAACRAARSSGADAAGAVHPGERIVPPPMPDFRYPARTAAKRAPWWWPFPRRLA